MNTLERLIFDRTLDRLSLENVRLTNAYSAAKNAEKRQVCLEQLIAFHESWVKNVTQKIEKMYVRESPDMFAEVEELAYRQPWGRMPETHRAVKLKQYITNLGYGNSETNKISESIFDLLRRKKLRVKDVIYDANIMKVTSVDNLPPGILEQDESDSSGSEDESESGDDSSSEEESDSSSDER